MFRRNYLAAQGQQFAGVNGGGYAFDAPIGFDFASLASTAAALSFKFPFWIVPTIDTVDFGASILLDANPSSVGTPSFKIGRIQLVLSVSQVSSASSPSYTVKRYRSGASAAVATFNGTTVLLDAFSTAGDATQTGTQISNGTLVAGDVLALHIVSNGAGGAPVNSGTLLVDIEG